MGAQAKDTGYYRCYYKDVKAVIVGTTAVRVYVFIRGESQSNKCSAYEPKKIKIFTIGFISNPDFMVFHLK